jgi:hypothetical protein
MVAPRIRTPPDGTTESDALAERPDVNAADDSDGPAAAEQRAASGHHRLTGQPGGCGAAQQRRVPRDSEDRDYTSDP